MNRQQQIDRFLLAAHKLAVARLRAEPQRVVAVHEQLARWRARCGATRSDAYWDEWQRLLSGDVGRLEQVVCVDDEHGAVLRNVSPMSVLISQAERTRLLREARDA